MVRGKYLPAGLHAAEASYVSPPSAISAFRAAIVRAVWSSKMPRANAPAILNLVDGPVGIDPAFLLPSEEPRIFRMLDLISGGLRVMVWFISFFFLLGMGRSKDGFGFLFLLLG